MYFYTMCETLFCVWTMRSITIPKELRLGRKALSRNVHAKIVNGSKLIIDTGLT